ncbi:LCP family protein [Xylanimonas sp. McL0601]|uniref:LCP family protein n=1 Tax=Xylanimonas sp. McL0601 TaxID=3414739 RepID=UPI003CEE8742
MSPRHAAPSFRADTPSRAGSSAFPGTDLEVAEDEAPRHPAHARSLAHHRVMRTVGMVLTALLAFGVAGGATAAVKLTGNIKKVDAEQVLADAGVARPRAAVPTDPNAGTPLNIVLMGTDTRDGANANFASSENTGGARSDTTIVMHISGDRSRIDMVSIPRDSTVDIPSCVTANGKKTAPWGHTKFNAAFSQGYTKGGDLQSAGLCTMQTVEKLTDVRMQGFIVVDFAGFAGMIDALGGVDICIPEAIDAPEAGNLKLAAGNQHLDGGTSLQFARARHGVGDGSDIQRIARQQQLLAAVAREVLGANLLTDSPKLLQFLNATTSSLTMSSNFSSVTGLAGLAYSLRSVRPDTITFMTVPWAPDPQNPKATIVWTRAAGTIWDNLNADRPATTPEGAASTPTPAASPATPSATAASTPAAGDAATTAPATPAQTPTPSKTVNPNKGPFTGADTTAVCG